MSNNILRPLRRLFTGIGGSLPGLSNLHHGVIAIKRAASTEDEVHIGLRDSSNVMQWRRMLTKTYADTLYADIANEHAAVTVADTTSIDLTLTGQQVSAAAIFGTSSGTVAEGNHNHDADYADIAHSHGSAESGRTFKAFYPTVGVNTFQTVNCTLNTPSGTQSTTDDVEGPWHGFTTGGTSGNSAGIDSDAVTWIDWNPTIIMHMGDCAGTTTRRIWCGLFESTPSASDDPAIDGCGFRYSAGASDTNWQAWSNDGTGGGTITDTGVAFAANTPFKMEMRCTSGQIEFYIDDTLEATHSTNLPATSTELSMYFQITTLTNATRAMSIGKYEMWHDQ